MKNNLRPRTIDDITGNEWMELDHILTAFDVRMVDYPVWGIPLLKFVYDSIYENIDNFKKIPHYISHTIGFKKNYLRYYKHREKEMKRTKRQRYRETKEKVMEG